MSTPLTAPRFNFRLALVLGAMAALSGCRIQKPATEVPPAPSIDSFTASATELAGGERVTLTWATTNATAIELREANTGTLAAPADSVDGSFEFTVERSSLFVLVARGAGGTDARALSVTVAADGPSSISFQALPPTINGGDTTTLVWAAPGATSASITAGGQAIDLGGQRSSGAVVVSPRFDTTYTLTVDGQTRTAQVTVSPVILTAQLSTIASEVGEPLTVSWTVAGADRVVVSSTGRGQIFETTMASQIASGSFADTVPQGPAGGVVLYKVEAFKGTERVVRELELSVGVGVVISRFVAPPVAAAGATYSVRWETGNADQVELLVDGVSVYRSPTVQAATVGIFAFTAPAQDFAVEVIATNVRGGRDTELAQVDSVGVPAAVTLSANPTTVAIGQPVTLTFASTEARRVRIVNAQGEAVFSVTGQTAESGSVQVYPTADTTYTISADNLLGNPAVTATAAVTVTGTAVSVEQTPPTALSGQIVTLSTAAPGALLYGFPHNQVLLSSQADFVDISATGTRVLESPTDVASIDLPFSTVLWGRRFSGPLTISRAGWMAWAAPQTVLTSNPTSLPSTSGPAALLAPFWDDLTLVAGTSGVFAQVVGNAPDEKLIVQWNRVRVGTSSSTSLTFQVQVDQRGLVSYQYGTMTPGSSASFVIGYQSPSRRFSSSSTTMPASNSARYFFSPVSPPIDVRLFKGQFWGGVVKTGSVYTPVLERGLAVELPTDLSLTELMFRPHDAVAQGQYLEVLNRTGAPLDLTGWELRAPNTPTFHVPANYVLAPGVATVIGGSTDATQNDDAGVTLAWGSFTLSQDAGSFTVGTADAGATFNYNGPEDGGRGVAIEVEPGPFAFPTGNPGFMACPATSPYGSQTPLQLGTPGTAAANCGFPYVVQSIPVHFVDVSDGGIRLVNSPTSEVDSRTVTIRLAIDGGTDPAPFTFGARRPVVSMSLDGWMISEPSTTSVFTNAANTGGTPLGKIAIFWDDMHTTPNRTPVSDMFWKRIGAGEDAVTPAQHWIFQWSHVRHYGTSPADDLNYEIKLFDDGVIEYHYGVMTSGTAEGYADGNSATVWLEQPDGGSARVIGINSPVIRPNTAYRFVPR